MRLIILGILVIIIVFLISRFFRANQLSIPALRPSPVPITLDSPNPAAVLGDSSDQLETYSNFDYHFSFQYPKGWAIDAAAPPKGFTLILTSPDYQVGPAGFPQIESGGAITVEIKPVTSANIDSYYSANRPKNTTISNYTSTTISQIPAIQFDSRREQASTTETWFINDHSLFQFSIYSPDNTSNSMYVPVYQHMLDTLIFTPA